MELIVVQVQLVSIPIQHASPLPPYRQQKTNVLCKQCSSFPLVCVSPCSIPRKPFMRLKYLFAQVLKNPTVAKVSTKP